MPHPSDAQQEIVQRIKAHLTDTSSLSTVVNTLAEPIETADTAGEVQSPDGQSTEDRLWTLWYSIIGVAKETPHSDSSNQTALVNLIAALKSRPNPHRPQGREDLKTNWVWNGSGELWSDLVILGASMRESWNDTPMGWDEQNATTVDEWTNLNAFVARVTAAGVRDFSLYAIWSMRETLETDSKAETLERLLPASAMWILYAGRQLYHSQQEWPASPTEGNPAGGGPLWTGKSGFCKQRWTFWKTRFEAITRRNDINQATKGIAADAIMAMDAIENGS